MCQASRALRRLSMGKEPLGDSTNIEKLWSVSCQCPGRLTIVANCCGSCNEVCHFLRSSLLKKIGSYLYIYHHSSMNPIQACDREMNCYHELMR